MANDTTDHQYHQDFSFPVINNTTTSYAIDSPPCPAAAAPYSISCREQEASTKLMSGEEESDEDGDYKDCFTIADESLMIKSCSSATGREREKRIPLMVEIELDEKEREKEKEKMDILWEDFNNDELFKRNSSTSRLMDGDHDVVSIGCIEALRFSKPPTTSTGSGGGGSGAIFSARKTSFVEFIKVLKKLFLLHNSHHRSVVKRPPTCHRHHPVRTKSRRILI